MEHQDIAFCPHCGNNSPQKLVTTVSSLHNNDGAHNYYFMQCLTCNEALVYQDIDLANQLPQLQYFNLSRYLLVYPKSSELHDSVPQSVRNAYREANRIKNIAPNAFAGQIRRALEALCKDRGTSKRVLVQNLKELSERGEIPPRLTNMTDLLRQFGNIGSHAGDEEVDPDYVDVIDEFFRTIVEYVYIAPYKLDKFVSHLEEVRKLKSG